MPIGKHEVEIQANVRLLASVLGWRLWRNNLGVLKDARGVPIRYGLANDSSVVNKSVKSGDLIGIRPVVITPEMVGTVIGQFVSIECKREGWVFNPNDKHEESQARWAQIVNELGGYAVFSTGDL
jgi:hypothetical protein